MLQIYGNFGSGNCLKVKYIADAIGLPFELREVRSRSGETGTPEFLKLAARVREGLRAGHSYEEE